MKHNILTGLLFGAILATVSHTHASPSSFDDRPILEGDSAEVSGEVSPNHPSWWSWTAPMNGTVVIDTHESNFNTFLGVYIGDDDAQLDAVVANDNFSGRQTSEVAFQATGQTTYRIGVFSANWNVSGAATMKMTFKSNRNGESVIGANNFADRRTVTGAQIFGLSNNARADMQLQEPPSGGGGKTVWWSWTSPSDGLATVDTVGSEFDTILKIYVGEQIDALTPIRWNNNTAGEYSAKTTFQAKQGETYQICVDTSNANIAGGNISLKVALEQNYRPGGEPGMDNFNQKRVLPGSEAIGIGYSGWATRQPGEPQIGTGPSVWWTWTAPANGQTVIDTAGSKHDTMLAIYTGDSVDALKLLVYDDNSGGEKTSRIQFTARLGQSYQIAVAPADANERNPYNIVLNLNQQVPPDVHLRIRPAMEVELFARQDVLYQLQRSPDLMVWENVSAPFMGANRLVSWLFPVRESQHYFYRTNPLAAEQPETPDGAGSTPDDSTADLPNIPEAP